MQSVPSWNPEEKKKIRLNLKIRDRIKGENVSANVTLSAEQLALLLAGKFYFDVFGSQARLLKEKKNTTYFFPDLKSAREETKRLPC